MDARMIDAILNSPTRLVLVTVVGVDGSTPRHLGSGMLVGGNGLVAGTIGGGMGEYWSIAAAKECLTANNSAILELDYTGEDPLRRVMICGGTSRLLVELLDGLDPYRMARAALNENQSGALAKQWAMPRAFGPWPPQPVDGWTVGRLAFIESLTVAWQANPRNSPAPAYDPLSPDQYYFDWVKPLPRLVILGAGHVGQALAHAAAALDFSLVVADDRPEYLRNQLFPPNTQLESGSYSEIIRDLRLGTNDFVVAVSRGHLCDLECLRAMLTQSAAYFGLIGSDRKIKLLFDQARQDGFAESLLDKVYAPIGLEIGSETPAEIAISILAQIIAVRRQAAV